MIDTIKTPGFLILSLVASLATLAPLQGNAATAQWALDPVDETWYTPANWSSNRVPGFFDTAIFDVSNKPEVSTSGRTTTIDKIVFAANAPAYQITSVATTFFGTLDIFNGIDNQSAQTQDFISVAAGNGAGTFSFSPAGDAGTNTRFTNQAAVSPGADWGRVLFLTDASAGSAQIINEGAAVPGAFGGETQFYNDTIAAEALIINRPGTGDGAAGGRTRFWLKYPRAGNAQIVCEGATVSGAYGGEVFFQNASSAGKATVIAESGSNGGAGGLISFQQNSRGALVRIELFGNEQLDLSLHSTPDVTIGSLEGDGPVFLADLTLNVGSNALNTVYSGNIQDSGGLSKVGPGTLTLAGASTYTGNTTVSEGTLVVSNSTGSATGTGMVSVETGSLGGSGIITGPVTVGTGSGAGASLAPAHGGNRQLTLTIQDSLTFNSDATYTYTFKAQGDRSKIDKVVANGVTIDGGATFNLIGTTQGTLTQGTVLTVIKNTAAAPIAGSFSNLPDGTIVNVDGNNLQASYKGGDGNDLTLTVVP
ncbi:MAG: autotransporter-associated beta strand repeat-containing protein [Chthoniobacterales bacterium]